MNKFEFEQDLWQKGYKFIAGCDEVGRGCIAGPVFACAIIMDPQSNIAGVNDSKQISDKKRRELKIKEILLFEVTGYGKHFNYIYYWNDYKFK